jgi:tol-pal system protein YbgF
VTLPRSGAIILLTLAGCATRADILQQDRQFRTVMTEQRRQLQQVQKEVERLRGDVEEGGTKGSAKAAAGDDRVTSLEDRVARLEAKLGIASPNGEFSPPPGEAPVPVAPPPAAAPAPSAVPPPVVATGDDDWRRDVAKEQSAAGAVNVPERADYLVLLDGVARGDCAKVIPQLNGFAAAHKESPLADNALYWAARCYAQRKDQNQAISKFYDLVQRYPKSDKAPAALWAQGNLFIDLGDSPDARLAFSKLIRDYPNSDEASRARQKLSELEH